MKTIEDLRDDLALQEEEADIWLERRAAADRERTIAHLHFMEACKKVDRLRAELIVANGESS